MVLITYEFANQNGVSANYSKNFPENSVNRKCESFWFKVINFVIQELYSMDVGRKIRQIVLFSFFAEMARLWLFS